MLDHHDPVGGSQVTRGLPGSGDVRGRRIGGILRFLGVPFAEPPVGALRFRAPEPVTPWKGVRDAREYGAWAPQPPHPLDTVLPRHPIPGDDYLTLNIWASEQAVDAPVMVYVHGGSFVTGSGAVPMYDGTTFARNGVVLVTVNYRLGVDGFLWTGEGAANLGLRDQILALEWVRDNIRAFGGDPSNVTLFGESAGAASVVSLLASPLAVNLFHRVIAQSGAGEMATDQPTAELIARRLARRLRVEPTRAAIAEVPMDVLLREADALAAQVTSQPFRWRWKDAARTSLAFLPVIDGDVLPAQPTEAIRGGMGHDVDLLVGSNTDEARLFTVPTGLIDHAPPGISRVLARRYRVPHGRAKASYRRRKNARGRGRVATELLTDGLYRVPALRLASVHPRSYVYEFAWRSPAFEGALRAAHVTELPFVFGTLDDADSSAVVGQSPPRRLSEQMNGVWRRFAETGDPGWARFNPTRANMIFDVRSRVEEPDQSVDLALWTQHGLPTAP
ncbi:carboxylesterase/lipase family protein [uncultured Microbacterium sp.]|uniref:carboxylesterase/lipase family protein n=1 Tax=uncultured Microbacterium sp. TaxID=191216 RepID=UPI0025EF7B61|nr:carboxylesterase family protein [uncultured Microbacterium sp.]